MYITLLTVKTTVLINLSFLAKIVLSLKRTENVLKDCITNIQGGDPCEAWVAPENLVRQDKRKANIKLAKGLFISEILC